MKTSEDIDKITKALAEFQANVDHPQKDTEGYGYMYAPLENVINTVKPTLEKQGLAVTQSTVSEGEKVGVTTVLWHESGQYIEDLSMQEASNLISLLKQKEDKAEKMIKNFKDE